MTEKYNKLSHSPLVSTVVELRFESEMPSQVIAGLLYSSLMSKTDSPYKEFKELPIAAMPPELRDKDINLKYVPHYRISNDNYVVGVSNKVITISCRCKDDKYQGWEKYFKESKEVIGIFEKTPGISKEYNRIGVRFVNKFPIDMDVTGKISIKIDSPEAIAPDDERMIGFTTAVDNNVLRSRITFATKATFVDEDNPTVPEDGQFLDIDSFSESAIESGNVAFDLIDKAHDKTEHIFRAIIGSELIKEFE